MKIKKLILKNFRQFEDVEFDFTDADGKVLDVVVLAGVNGSGKSTILNFISDVFSRQVDPWFKGFFELDFSKDSLFNGLKTYTLGEKENHSNRNAIFNDIDNLRINMEFPTIPAQSNAFDITHLFNRGNIKKNNFINENSELITFEVTEQKILNDLQKSVFSNEHKTPFEVKNNVISSLNRGLEALKTNIRLVNIEFDKLLFSNEKKNDLSFSDLSNGEQQLFFQIFTLHNLNLNNGILLIDEPEDAMHPTWQREILNVYKGIGHNNQVFVATHSPQILASVKPESLFVLSIDEDTHKIQVTNMAKAHQNTKGLEPNRILSEIMGTPLRDYETQARIDALNELIREAQPAPNGTLETIETDLEELTKDLGRQDGAIMRFNHEVMLLKRKKAALGHEIH